MKIKFKYKIALIILNALSKTWRIKINGQEPKDSAVIAFWHGFMLPVWKYFSKYEPVAVVSRSQDGEMLSQLLIKWGYDLIRGSSSHGGKEVLDEITDISKDKIVLITPDGPRGPIYNFKPGAIIASQRSGSELFLCNVEIKYKYSFKKSWDNFSLPLLFSKITLNVTKIGKISKDYGRDEINNLINQCQDILNSK
jgi:lysophospholipid acyltransferase (LPLAT)-like uncharacterized protein